MKKALYSIKDGVSDQGQAAVTILSEAKGAEFETIRKMTGYSVYNVQVDSINQKFTSKKVKEGQKLQLSGKHLTVIE